MPIDSFRLENFMAFEDTGWIELRKINLLLGRNSSGKSAIIRALRLMKQSWLNERLQLALQTDRQGKKMQQPLTFVIEGGVNLGSFGAIVHRKASKPEVKAEQGSEKIALPKCPECGQSIAADGSGQQATEIEDDQYAIDEQRRYSEPVTFSFRGEFALLDWDEAARNALFALLKEPQREADEPLVFHVSASYRQHKEQRSSENPDGQIYLWKLDFGVSESLTADDFTLLWGYEIIDVEFDSLSDGGYAPYVQFFSPLPNKAIPHLGDFFSVSRYDSFLPDLSLKPLSKELQRFKKLLPQLKAMIGFWQICQEQITSWLESIVHVGPIRPLPQRSYALTEEFRRTMEIGGWQAFLSYLWRNDEKRDSSVNYWLGELSLGKKLKRYPMTKPEYEYEMYSVKLRLDETGNGDERDITDIGLGASQVLPVIVQSLAADSDALVLIEQPELHLHPEAQAVLAEMFIESVNEMEVPRKPETRLAYNPRQIGEEAAAKQLDEKRVPVKRRYLIETHSEHFMLRTQLKIAERAIHKEPLPERPPTETEFEVQEFKGKDFTLIFTTRNLSRGNSTIERIKYDRFGRIMAPSKQFRDFFGRDFKDATALSLAIAEAMDQRGEK